MADKEIHYLGLLEVGRQIQSRERSSVEVTQAMLARIDALDPKLKSYVTVMRQRALVDARRADEEIAKGLTHGPLHGVPISVKDLLCTRSIPTGS